MHVHSKLKDTRWCLIDATAFVDDTDLGGKEVGARGDRIEYRGSATHCTKKTRRL